MAATICVVKRAATIAGGAVEFNRLGCSFMAHMVEMSHVVRPHRKSGMLVIMPHNLHILLPPIDARSIYAVQGRTSLR